MSISGRIMAGIAGAIALTGASIPTDPPVPAPQFKPGETWIFDQTTEGPQGRFGQRRLDLAIDRIGDETMDVGIKQDGAPTAYEDHVVGRDWSLRILADGKETTTARPFSFPMAPGQSWTVDYTDNNRRGMQTSLHVHRTYQARHWEDITVPAGTFHALKIEGNGIDQATLDVPQVAAGGAAANSAGSMAMTATRRGGIQTVTQRHYSELFYVPELHYYAKSVQEEYNGEDVRVSRETRVLVAHRAAA